MELTQTRASVDAFRSAVLASEALQAQLRVARSADDVAALARSAGFAMTARDVERIHDVAAPELTDAELETVAGALPCWCDPSVVDSKSCG